MSLVLNKHSKAPLNPHLKAYLVPTKTKAPTTIPLLPPESNLELLRAYAVDDQDIFRETPCVTSLESLLHFRPHFKKESGNYRLTTP